MTKHGDFWDQCLSKIIFRICTYELCLRPNYVWEPIINSKRLFYSHSFILILITKEMCRYFEHLLRKDTLFFLWKKKYNKLNTQSYLTVDGVIGKRGREVIACLKSSQNEGQNVFNTSTKGFRGGVSKEADF